MTSTSTTTTALTDQLTRCDKCGARGAFKIMLPSGLDLVFCGHHYVSVDFPPVLAISPLPR